MIESSSCGSDERLSEEVEVRDSHAEDVLELEDDAVLDRLRVLLIRYEEYVDRSLYSLELCFLFASVELLDSDDWESVCFCEAKKWRDDELRRSFGFSGNLFVNSHGVLMGSSTKMVNIMNNEENKMKFDKVNSNKGNIEYLKYVD